MKASETLHGRRAALAMLLMMGVAGGLQGAPVHAEIQKTAVPFIQKHCAQCHGGKATKAGLDLVKADKADEAVLRDRKQWQNVLRQVGAGEMPPAKQPRPTAAEVEQFARAVEAAFERAELTMRPDPGHVTMRRLNRAEYLNTVRDLLHVDFDPTEGFPADEIGHGFDNIGDVLTISPLLMERYMDAAEAIAQRVILERPPKPAIRYLSGRFLQPNNAQTSQGRFRMMDANATEPVHSGPFAAPGDYLKFSANDELIFRATLYAEPRGKAPVRVALFLQGKDLPGQATEAELKELMGAGLPGMKPMAILKTFEITARDAARPQTVEIPIRRVGGINRAGIALIRPPEGEAPAKVFIEHLWSEGPLETRPESQRMLLACTPGKPVAEQTREVLNRLLSGAYRRPATASEMDAMAALVARTAASGRTWEAGVQQALVAVLCSPKFLFRVEQDSRPQAKQAHPLDEYQLASRLSYFLWSTMPDAELFDLAGKGQLTAQLDAQVQRMLQSPKTGALAQNFALQWLQLQRLKTAAPDPRQFPAFNDALKEAMLRETTLFFGEIVRENRTVLDLMEGNFTYLNEPLARLYGIADTAGNRLNQKKSQPGGQPIPRDAFVRVSLPMAERGGVLLQGSVLTVTSNPTRTSPVKRGRWVLEQMLGTPPPAPPPDVPELDRQQQLTGTLRQRMEQHRKNPACASCHAQMDAMGFALEHYDAIGAWREMDGNLPVDDAGALPDGKSFAGPAGLKALLRDKRELVLRNLAENMLTYALGRGLEYYDGRAVRQIVATTVKEDFRFASLVSAIVRSDPFRLRRGSEAGAPE